jgi:sec-independent protein translocase protein TatC
MKRRAKKPTARKLHSKASLQREKLPLIEHLYELRRRLFYVAVCVATGSAIAYGFEHQLIDILLRPSHGQSFIYTSPLGGINFLFSVCLYLGVIVSTPVIFYQLLAFLRPLIKKATRRLLLVSSALAGVVAIGGVIFGYFVGLPSALHFLLHQFVTVQVRPLITIQSYMSFVGLYLVGSALMFQLPLIIYFINRIKPLKPGGLLKYERHVILFALITAFIMNPTPNLLSQMIVVIPIILMYQVSIIMVWVINRGGKRAKFRPLFERDAALKSQRQQQAALSRPIIETTDTPPLEPIAPLTPTTAAIFSTPVAPRPYATSASPAARALPVYARGNRADYQFGRDHLLQ